MYFTDSLLLILNNITDIITSSSDSKGEGGELQTGRGRVPGLSSAPALQQRLDPLTNLSVSLLIRKMEQKHATHRMAVKVLKD